MRLLLLILLIFSFGELFASPFLQRSNFPGPGRHRATGISIGNKGYLGLGHVNGTGVETYYSDWWEYDPSSDTWTQKADFIGNSGNGELGAQGFGLETVGYVGVGELDHLKLFKYDPATNSWVAVANAPSGILFQDTDTFVIGHKCYFMDLYTGNMYVYDADLDQWSLRAPFPGGPNFSFAAFSINGYGYIKIYDQLWKYSPSSDQWNLESTFPGLAELSSIRFVQNGKAYLVCGYDGIHTNVVKETWEYDPATNSWLQLEDFIGTARRYSTSFTIGNRCFFGTGTNGTNFSDFWEFDRYLATQQLQQNELSIYPNPSSDHFKVNTDSPVSITVLTLDGKRVIEVGQVEPNEVITIDHLTTGSYIYMITDAQGNTSTGNLIKD